MLEGHPRSSNDDNDDYRAHLVVYFLCAIDCCIPKPLYPVTLNFEFLSPEKENVIVDFGSILKTFVD